MDEGLTSRAILGDCMDVMRKYPDKYFDLAVVDPPYGGGWGNFIGLGENQHPGKVYDGDG